MAKEMLINVAEAEECRMAILEDGVLQELYMERAGDEAQVGNIYKARVMNVEPSIQAAFIEYGASRNGFLHISDLQAQYFPKNKRVPEPVGKKTPRKDRPPIQDCLRRGQEIVVQVIKAGIGTKGPTLTTYLSIPGRFLVMMPGMSRLGVSRKIEDEDERQKLRKSLDEINPPEDIGFIVRTAGMGHPKKDLQQDLTYLQRLWRTVERRITKAKAPAELYQESDLVIRTIRDVYSSEIKRIICDDAAMSRKVADFLKVAMPRTKNEVLLYNGASPLFNRYGLEHEIEKIYSRHVDLPGGASLVIDQAEALVAIDVNSGRNRVSNDAEETAYRTNLSAAKEVARQLRLRDMGGVVVIDFIDMRYERHQREIEHVLKTEIKKDRARSKVLKLSRFGLIEMTRQRIRPSLKRSIYGECPYCNASGLIKSDESLALSVMRSLQLAGVDERIATIDLTISPRVAEFLSNSRRAQLAQLEARTSKVILIHSESDMAGDEVRIECRDERGGIVVLQSVDSGTKGGPIAPAPQNLTGAPSDDELIDADTLPPAPAAATGMMEFDEDEDESDAKPQTDKEAVGEEAAGEEAAGDATAPKRRRRRGGRKHRRKGAAEGETAEGEKTEGEVQTPQSEAIAERPVAEEGAEEAAVAQSAEDGAAAQGAEETGGDGEAAPKRRRRRRGGRKHRRKTTGENGEQAATGEAAEPAAGETPEPVAEPAAAGGNQPAKTEAAEGEATPTKRRRRRGGRKHRRRTEGEAAEAAGVEGAAAAAPSAPVAEAEGVAKAEETVEVRPSVEPAEAKPAVEAGEAEPAPKTKPKRPRRRGGQRKIAAKAETEATVAEAKAAPPAPAEAVSKAPTQAVQPISEPTEAAPAAKAEKKPARKPAAKKVTKKKTVKKAAKKTVKKAAKKAAKKAVKKAVKKVAKKAAKKAVKKVAKKTTRKKATAAGEADAGD